MNCQNINSQKKGGAVKYLLAGMGAGAAVGVVGKVLMDNNKRTLQKKAGKVADAMENLIDSAKDIFQ